MTPLALRLARRIAAMGPITVADYMAAALGDPDHGYYAARRLDSGPIGAAGDFVTAPEISQTFGECIGAWLTDCWDQMGRPARVRLIELGPGRGTLMADALRITRNVPGWRDAIDLDLIEINPGLRAMQSERLGAYAPNWRDSLAEAPDGPMLLVANEFLDAMPIRQLVYRDGAWRENLIGWDAAEGFRFVPAAAPSPLGLLIPPALRRAEPGEIFEISTAAIGVVTEIARRIARHGGAALLIDYGHTQSRHGGSLQAVFRHRRASVLDYPGAVDLSAHVDFAPLVDAARQAGSHPFGPIPQGAFLTALGIGLRAERLKRAASPDGIITIDAAIGRLTGAEAMGDLFKAFAIAAPGIAPAGFERSC